MSLLDKALRRIDVVAICIFVLALGARLLHTLAIRESPFFEHLLVDSVDFHARAVAFQSGMWPDEGAFYQAPLYPLFLSFLYRIFGQDLLAVRLAQAVLGSLSAVLVYSIGRRCAGRAAGMAAGAMYALYAMAIHFDSEILRPSLVVFLSLSALALLLEASRRRGLALWALAGILLGLASVARPTVLVFLPPAFLWAVLRNGRPAGLLSSIMKPRLFAAVFALCALVPVAAVTYVNYDRSGSFVPISYNGGINFYIGNNPDYDKTVGIRPGIRWDLLTAEPPEDRRSDPSGWSRHFYNKSKDYILSNPGRYAALLVKKFVLFWNGYEIERNTSFKHVAEHSFVFARPLVSFRWIAPLAILGLILAWRRRAPMGLPALLLISQVFATVLFFVCARYRMTSAPILCLFAGYAVVALARMIRGRRPGALAYGGIALVLALAVNVDAYGISQKRYSRPEYELALVERREGNTDETARLLERAAAVDAEDPDPPFQIGILKVGRGKYEEAATYFRAAADLEPRYSRSWFNLGFCQSRSGDVAGAANSFKRALEIEPTYWEAAMGLGDALLSEGEYTGAAATYGWSKDIVRNHGQAAVSAISHGRALALLGEYESSLAQFDEALGHAPGSVDARLAKARVLLALDRPQEAAREVWLAAASDSSNARVKAMIEELGIAAGAPGDD